MGQRVVICGHGAAQITAPKTFVTVPRGCTISFYTEFNKTLAGGEADAIAAGTSQKTPTRVITEYKTCPDLIVTPLTAAEKLKIENAKPVGTILLFAPDGGQWTLAQIFDGYGSTRKPFDFHWTCCQALMTKNMTYDMSKTVGNSMTGVNMTEMDDGFYQYDYTKNKYIKVATKNGYPITT